VKPDVSRSNKNRLRSALFRISVLLTVILLFAVVWEYRQNLNLMPSDGKVIQVKEVFAGRGGDNREFVIEYFIDGDKHMLVTRRGIIDAFGAFCCLSVGDTVPIAVDRDTPFRTILDSFNARYSASISFGALTLFFLIFMVVVAIKGRLTK